MRAEGVNQAILKPDQEGGNPSRKHGVLKEKEKNGGGGYQGKSQGQEMRGKLPTGQRPGLPRLSARFPGAPRFGLHLGGGSMALRRGVGRLR